MGELVIEAAKPITVTHRHTHIHNPFTYMHTNVNTVYTNAGVYVYPHIPPADADKDEINEQ